MLSKTTMNPSVSESKLYLFYVEIDDITEICENEDCHEHINLYWLTYKQISNFFAKGDAAAPSKLLWAEFNNKILNNKLNIIQYTDTDTNTIFNENIIFCDCDGVLIRNDENNLEDPEEYYYDDNMMLQLLNFAYETNSKIVITSAWREIPDDETNTYFGINWPNPLPAIRSALGELYIGDAPSGMNKAKAIYKWIANNNFIGNFVILDDENKDFIGTDLENKLVLTNPI
jgi:hypothetical protein